MSAHEFGLWQALESEQPQGFHVEQARWAHTMAALANGPMARTDSQPWRAEHFMPRAPGAAAAPTAPPAPPPSGGSLRAHFSRLRSKASAG